MMRYLGLAVLLVGCGSQMEERLSPPRQSDGTSTSVSRACEFPDAPIRMTMTILNSTCVGLRAGEKVTSIISGLGGGMDDDNCAIVEMKLLDCRFVSTLQCYTPEAGVYRAEAVVDSVNDNLWIGLFEMEWESPRCTVLAEVAYEGI